MDSQIKGALRSTSKQVVVAVQRWQLSSATDGLPDTQPYAGAPVVRSEQRLAGWLAGRLACAIRHLLARRHSCGSRPLVRQCPLTGDWPCFACRR
jgi:hypothetical protein